MGDVGWLTVSSYVFYCHRGSFSQPTGNPRAARSISGNLLNKLCILSSMSLLGEMMSRNWEKFTKNPCWWKRFCICSFEVFYKVFSRTFILLRQHCHTIDENGLITKMC